MLTVHHLETPRSQRMLWLLEELDAPYELRRCQRDPRTHLAPPELKRVHPPGKSPVITDVETALAFMDEHLAKHRWFAGEHLSMADLQMSSAVEHERAAYQRALSKSGPVIMQS